MIMRSHIDLGLFIQFVHVWGDRLPSDIQTLLEEDSDRQLLNTWTKHLSTMPSYLFHEAYHFWQGLRLPFVHRYGLQIFKNILDVAPLIKDLGDVLFEFSEGAVSSTALLGTRHLVVNPDGSIWTGRQEQLPAREGSWEVDLSPLDLMEGAATVAEWQWDTPVPSLDIKGFKRWCKRNPSYLKAFRFAACIVGDEPMTLRAFLPLVLAAFHTSDQCVHLPRCYCYLSATVSTRSPVGWHYRSQFSGWR